MRLEELELSAADETTSPEPAPGLISTKQKVRLDFA
jgi:hypothetical protein